jgi:putative FmdB family regulatory protein
MPVYEYLCEDHGPFEALRPMTQHAAPCACPDCGADSRRVLLTPPALGARDRGRMKAHAVNERSADSPKRSSGHGPGCGCCGGKTSSGTLRRPDGSKSFPAKRPWMISH